MAGAMLVVEALPVIKGCRPHSSARKSHFSPILLQTKMLLEKKIEPAVTYYKKERICPIVHLSINQEYPALNDNPFLLEKP
jgi:hypothetical protein